MTGCGSCFPPVHIQRCHELGINGRVRGGGIANTDARMCFSSFYCEKPAATRREGYQKYSPASLSSASYPLHLSVQLSQDWLPSAVNILYSVSYTHLRAHETRHDLVCRLLLEKKN